MAQALLLDELWCLMEGYLTNRLRKTVDPESMTGQH
jgi:hypothetical protein